ncbi:hypothetical protein [Treponema phagedenis]|uniref:hypothetical protein n=1 Tax=Treponema phagedenis TaxID=162 RepID=UPI0001F6380A|nr:hypothetical protein [Treponema phagedenis]EFW36779.1 hypothetical protein HMPREF9554_02742 [Treponema phagedenis F0421]TYT78588.1 hypothetical protein FS559_05355 [Treponema phagedenis]
MKKSIRFVIFLFFLILRQEVFASNIGFEINSGFVFLEKSDAQFIPDVVSALNASVFYTLDFNFTNQSLLLQPGVFINDNSFKNTTVLPFFRRLNYSAFTENFSFTAGKDFLYFGEGGIDNNFFINIPVKKNKNLLLWHLKFETFVKQFTFTSGAAVDTKNIDLLQPPAWYNLWGKIVYSHPVVLIGLESDWLFEPTIQKYKQEKSIVFKTAVETFFNLPKGFELYVNAKLPVNVLKKELGEWAVLAGLSKTFMYKNCSFISIAEGLYHFNLGFKYAFFQIAELGEYMGFFIGISGLENKELNLITGAKFFIGDLNFKLEYITKNFLLNKNTQGGIVSIGVMFNEKV